MAGDDGRHIGPREDPLWKALQHANGSGVVLTDLEGHILDMNAAYCDILGRTAEDLKSETLVSLTRPEDRQRYQAELDDLVSGKSTGLVSEHRYLYPNGDDVWVRTSVATVHDSEGHALHIIAVCENITERRKTQQALRESERLALVGRLSTSIAHEINNPLEVIANLIYLIREAEDPADVQRLADLAREELGRVTRIVVQTLQLHKQTPEPTATDIAQLVESILMLHRNKLVRAKIRLNLEKKNAPHLICFPGEIRQILVNLIDNAVDAMEGGGELRVRFGPATDWRTGASGVRITVADTGRGMTEAVRKRIYEPFFTSKGEKGTGLGLWVSASIIASHKGNIKVRSSQGTGASGTTFSIILPHRAG
jgi:PAS domain S-box-containing protein